MAARPSRPAPPWRTLGLALAALALLVRFAIGAAVLDPGVVSDLAALANARIDCGTTIPPPQDGPDRGRALASLAAALADAGAQPAPTLLPGIAVPEGRGALLVGAAPGPAFHGPPPVPPGGALPRGPPVQA